MSAFAAVTTGKGIGAIAVIQLFGDSAEIIIKKIFEPVGKKPLVFKTGEILLGTINTGSETIDQVTLGCEGPGHFAINCHGNPLIVTDIMQLLQDNGAALLTTEEFLAKIFSAEKPSGQIALEAKLALLQAKTIQGTKIIVKQINAGLTKTIEKWLRDINTISLEQIKTGAEQILEDSKIAKLLILGCKIALAGPPNTGKSTLLNFLAGRQKSIVTDIKGTTRDWVSVQCIIGPLHAELIDTAGLDEAFGDTIEKASQQKAFEILDEANLVLLVLDNSQPCNQLDNHLLEKITDKKILTILNKTDLPAKFDINKLPENLTNTVQISAKSGAGIEELLEKIQQACGVVNFDLKTAICFTPRQEKLLKQLKNTRSNQQALSMITELVKGPA
ncbi:MAG: 50S ribosome-binding GTPase [Phycisphaerae bacterium]|nr:50S ribosome-binding GTPase [Phycisphaerae bacterium]